MNTVFNINTDAAVAYTNRLERLGRNALPVAVRQTLNSAAFDVKTKTMPAAASMQFVERQPNFFKANSKVTQAQGINISAMKSTVGFVPFSGTNKALDDLEQQEHGGDIGGRSFIPLPGARSGKNWKKKVRTAVRISDIKTSIKDSKNARGKNARQKFTKSAVYAGKGGFVIGNNGTAGGNKILFQIRSIIRKNGNTVIKSVPLYAVKRNRKVKPAATHFMEQSSLQSANKMNEMYITNAKKQLAKVNR